MLSSHLLLPLLLLSPVPAAWRPGCGRLSTIYPETLMLGMEIRDKVSAYVRERIGAEAGLGRGIRNRHLG